MVVVKIFFMLLCPIMSIQNEDIDFLKSIMKNFNMKNVIIVKDANLKTKHLLMKEMFSENQFCQISNNVHDLNLETKGLNHDIVIYVNDINDINDHLNLIIKYSSTLVLIVKEAFENIIQLPMDKRVFIIMENSKEVFENYYIKEAKIHTKLGKFLKDTLEFQWEPGVEKDFFERRSNFHGQSLKIMTETAGNDIIFPKNFRSYAPYFQNNQTYLVTNLTRGLYVDVLLMLQSQLNFTYELYNRKDMGWGSVTPNSNGSFEATGMVSDIFYNRADLIVAGIAVTPERALYIDYLRPVTPYIVGLYIPSGNSRGEFQFDVFLGPFR